MKSEDRIGGNPAEPSRLFVAIRPTAPAAQALARLMTPVPGISWVEPPKLHLTLRFMGPADPGFERAAEAALERVRVKTFFLPVEGVGVFPPRGRANVLWAGLGGGHPLLHQLRQQVDDSLLAAALPIELRAFVPHITLGRCRDAPPVAVEHWLKRHRDFVGPIWPVDSFELMQSITVPGRVREYNPLRSYRLLH